MTKMLLTNTFFLSPIISICKIILVGRKIVKVNDGIPRVHKGHSVCRI